MQLEDARESVWIRVVEDHWYWQATAKGLLSAYSTSSRPFSQIVETPSPRTGWKRQWKHTFGWDMSVTHHPALFQDEKLQWFLLDKGKRGTNDRWRWITERARELNSRGLSMEMAPWAAATDRASWGSLLLPHAPYWVQSSGKKI